MVTQVGRFDPRRILPNYAHSPTPPTQSPYSSTPLPPSNTPSAGVINAGASAAQNTINKTTTLVRSGGGGSSGGGGTSPYANTLLNNSMISVDAINQGAQTAQQKLDMASKLNTSTDTYNYKGGYGTYGTYGTPTTYETIPNRVTPFETISSTQRIKNFFMGVDNRQGNKPLTAAQETSLRQQAGLAGTPIGNGQYSFTQSGRGTIMTEQPKEKLTQYDLANVINGPPQNQANAITTQNNNKVIADTATKYTDAANNLQTNLQAQVNSGKMSVNDANKFLQDNVAQLNKQFVQEVTVKATELNSNDPRLASIQSKLNTDLIKNGVTADELKRQVSKFEKTTDFKPETARMAAEVIGITAATIIGGPAAGVTAGYLVGASRIASGAMLEKDSIPVVQLTKDSSGKVIAINIVDRLNPKADAEYFAGLTYVVGSAGSAISAIGSAIDNSIAKAALKNGVLTIEELQKGVANVEVKSFTGGTKTLEFEIPNAQKVLKQMQSREEQLRNIALGRDEIIATKGFGTIEEKSIITKLLEKDPIAKQVIKNTDITFKELARSGKLSTSKVFNTKTGAYEDVYTLQLKTEIVKGESVTGRQIDWIFRARGGQIVDPMVSVIDTDPTKAGTFYISRLARSGEKFKYSVAVPENVNGLEVTGGFRNVLSCKILLSAKTLKAESDLAYARLINKKQVVIQTGIRARGSGTQTFEELIRMNPNVVKRVQPKILAKASAQELQIFPKAAEKNILRLSDAQYKKLMIEFKPRIENEKLPKGIFGRYYTKLDLAVIDKNQIIKNKLLTFGQGVNKEEVLAHEIGHAYIRKNPIKLGEEQLAKLQKDAEAYLKEIYGKDYAKTTGYKGKEVDELLADLNAGKIKKIELNIQTKSASITAEKVRLGITKELSVTTKIREPVTFERLSKPTIQKPVAPPIEKKTFWNKIVESQKGLFSGKKGQAQLFAPQQKSPQFKPVKNIELTQESLQASANTQIEEMQQLSVKNLEQFKREAPLSIYSSTSSFNKPLKISQPKFNLKTNTINLKELYVSPRSVNLMYQQKLRINNLETTREPVISSNIQAGLINERILNRVINNVKIGTTQTEITMARLQQPVLQKPRINTPPAFNFKPAKVPPFEPYPISPLPSGRVSLSLGELQGYNPNYKFKQRKTSYTASLGSAIFGISKKVKQKDLAKTLARLNSMTFSGVEQRPTIEVIPNKPQKKINMKKMYKALNF